MNEIMEKIIKNGFEAYIVGGYVRDYILGRKSYDVDICTNAPINEIIRIFGKRGTAYKKYFSYHIDEGEYSFDITSYRKELEYKRNKPINIELAHRLKEDLIRRDFTINTFALDMDYHFYDLLNAKEDLDNKIIKTVGSPFDRFNEDKTRIIRAIRFCCTLDFELDGEIKEFLKSKAYLLNEVPREYIRNEIDKIFDNKSYDKFFKIVKEYKLEKYLKINFDKIIPSYDKYGLWAQIETELPFSNEEKDIISNIKKFVESEFEFDELINYRKEIVNNVVRLLSKDEEYNSYIDNNKLHSIIDMDIDIKTINNYVGIKNTKRVYKLIEKNILNGNLNNNRCDIINYLKGKMYE